MIKINIIIRCLIIYINITLVRACNFEELPLKVKKNIFKQLPRKDIVNLAFSSKYMYMHASKFLEDEIYTLIHNSTSIEGFNSAFRNERFIKKVRLTHLPLTTDRMQIVGTTTNITYLDLSYSRIDKMSWQILFKNLRTNRSIITLKLSGTGLRKNHVKKLCKSLARNNTIEHLDLSYNKIKDKGARYIGMFLLTNRSVTNINITSNRIKSRGMKKFLESVIHNGKMQHLSISSNEGCSNANCFLTICRIIEECPSLRILHMRNLFVINYASNNEMRMLGNALQKNCTLEELDLDNNQVSDQGIDYIGQALEMNSSLKILSLLYNKIGDRGIQAFSSSLMINKSVTALYISENPYGEIGDEFLHKLLNIKENLFIQANSI